MAILAPLDLRLGVVQNYQHRALPDQVTPQAGVLDSGRHALVTLGLPDDAPLLLEERACVDV
eukprot:3460593-Alexandrium_andersonii.AAC.1